MDIKNIKDDELIEIYKMVYTNIHSNGFMIQEMKDMLFYPNYIFLYKPLNGFLKNVENYISEKGYELPEKFLFNYKKINS